MDFLTDWLTDWLKELLIGGIMGNLEGLFDTVNAQVGEIAVQVGTTPAAWNAGVFSLIRQLSETVILPIAGLVLTFVAKGGAVIPRPGKEDLSMANTQTAVQTAEELAAAQEEMRRLIFEAPIAELAEHQGISVDEAVALRVEQNLAATIPIEVSVRPIEPQGKLIGFASVNFGGVVVDDFKVVNGQNGVFLGAPSKPDPTSRSGYRATVRINDRATQERLNAAGVQAYNMAVEKLLARAEAVRPAPIREQMDKAGKEAAQKNAARSAPAKGKEGRDGR